MNSGWHISPPGTESQPLGTERLWMDDPFNPPICMGDRHWRL
jgi:hypothetical protein